VTAKTIGVGVAAKIFPAAVAGRATSALLLAQVGEFSFVLEQSGRAVGLSPPAW
jgi:Kef-type K+ transport system membrane component KefB